MVGEATAGNGVHYEETFAELAQRQIFLTEAEKAKLKEISDHALENTEILFPIMTFIKNIFTGFSLKDIGGWISGAWEKTCEQCKLHHLETAAIEIDQQLKQQGGNLALAADLVSGQSDHGAPVDMPHSVFREVYATLNLPEVVPTTRLTYSQTGATTTLPPLPTPMQDRALTQGGRSS